jgi:serine/threonine protein kinase
MNYRAPESVIQAPWSYGVDTWATGVILLEMLTGRQLFALSHDDVHLHCMAKLLGPIPSNVLLRGWNAASQRGLLMYGPGGSVMVAPCSAEAAKFVDEFPSVESLVMKNGTKAEALCLDLVRKLMEYDASKRITAHEALRHPFFSERILYPHEEKARRRTRRRVLLVLAIVVVFVAFWVVVVFFPGVYRKDWGYTRGQKLPYTGFEGQQGAVHHFANEAGQGSL